VAVITQHWDENGDWIGRIRGDIFGGKIGRKGERGNNEERERRRRAEAVRKGLYDSLSRQRIAANGSTKDGTRIM
jgi:hypothetical protein